MRDNFSSKFGIIAASVGAAVGLGNIWKFPYMIGANGGGAFLVVYLACTMLIGFPLLLCELTIGRKSQKGIVGAFSSLSHFKGWTIIGYIGIFCTFVILTYYCVICGWCLEYLLKSLAGEYLGADQFRILEIFRDFVTNPYKISFNIIMFLLITLLVVTKGLTNGIERISKFLMPMFAVFLVILVVRVLMLDNSSNGLKYMFTMDFDRVSANTVLSAMGHSFFSLSIGSGVMITFGSYINKRENLINTAFQITLADTLTAILAGMAILPAVFAFGLNVDSGPSLIFITLPNVFSIMSGGRLFGSLFFSLLFIAAITSVLAYLEVLITFLTDEFSLSRKVSSVICVTLIMLSSVACGVSYTNATFLSSLRILGLLLLDFFIWITDNMLLPFGGFMLCMFSGWVLGYDSFKFELSRGKNSTAILPVLMFIIKFIAPLSVGMILLQAL